MNVRYVVELNDSEREQLRTLMGGGKTPVRKLKRAQILLAADAGVGDDVIAKSVGAGTATVYRTKRHFVEGNLERALSEEPRPGASRKLSGKEEALLVATTCSNPPEGRARWTLDLLAGAMVKLTEHEMLSRETVRRRLAENELKPWRKDMWCIPKVDAEYVARMRRTPQAAGPQGRGRTANAQEPSLGPQMGPQMRRNLLLRQPSLKLRHCDCPLDQERMVEGAVNSARSMLRVSLWTRHNTKRIGSWELTTRVFTDLASLTTSFPGSFKGGTCFAPAGSSMG